MLLRKEKRRRTLYHDFFNLPEGKEVLADMARRHYVYATTHVPNDPYYTAFNEGRRAVILELMKLANAPIDQVQKTINQMETIHGRNDSTGDDNSDY